MAIKISDHFNYTRLIRFTLPSIAMMLFISIYGVVDGFFVSNVVGKTAFASVNLIMPFLQVLGGVGAMLGVGGSALVAKTLGEGKKQKAGQYFTMMIYLMVGTGILFSVLGIVFMRPVSYLLGATDTMIEDCVIYGRTTLLFNIALHAQYTFQSYLIVAGKPKLGLFATILAGVTNMVFDAVFMVVFDMGIAGAAVATGLSQVVGGVIPFVWFMSKKNQSDLHFTKTAFEIKPMLKACGNGASEMLTSVSGAITGMLYNLQLVKHAGEDGVAAYGVVMYAAFVFIAVFLGFCNGSSPVMGYHYGAQNHAEMKSLMKKSIVVLGISGFAMTAIATAFSGVISEIFVGYDRELCSITTRAFVICAFPFLIMGINIYASSLFTALNNGTISALISFARSLLLPVICITALPLVFKLDGVWYSLLVSEIIGFFVSCGFIIANKKRYNY